MQGTTEAASGRGRGRAVAATVCFVLAALLTTPAAIAFWAHRTLTDTERYVETVGPLVSRAEIQDVLATTVTNAIDQRVDVEAIVDDVFGDLIADAPRLQRLVGPLDAAISGLVEREVRAVLASDAFADVWVRINTRAQQVLVNVLEGRDSGAVQLEGDQVVLDLDELIAVVQDRLVARGLTIVENVPVPDIDRQIVLLDAPALAQARTIYAFASPIAQWLILVVAGVYLAALLLARNRARMTVAIGIAIAANALLVALALSIGRQLFVNELAGTVLGPASRVFYDVLLAYLARGWSVLLWLGLILVFVGWLVGSTRFATSTRNVLARGLESAGAGLADGPVDGASSWVAKNARWLRGAAVAAAAVVLLWGMDVSVSRLFASVLVAVALLCAVQVMVGADRAHQGDVVAA